MSVEIAKTSEQSSGAWEGHERTIAVAALGLASLGIYIFALALPYSLPRYFSTPLQDYARISGHTQTSGWSLIAAFLALFLIYAAAWVLMPRTLSVGRGLAATVLLLPVAFGITLLLVYPIGAADIFDYISHARLLPYHAANPFTVMPVAFPDDPFLPYIAWPYTTSAYGPLWELIASGTAWLAGDDLWRNLIAFKGLAILSYLVNAVLIYHLVSRRNPDWTWRAMLFYLWNPLVLFEVAANGHNDMLMMSGVLLGFYLLDRLRGPLWGYVGASAAFALGILVKFLAAPFLPLLWVDSWRKLRGTTLANRVSVVAISAGVAMLLLAAFYLPFYQPGVDILSSQRRQDMFTASLPNAAKMLLQSNGWAENAAATLARNLAFALLGLFYLWQMWRLGQGRTTLLRAGFEVLFFYLLISILWFQPWYLIWLVALAPLIPDWRVQLRTYVFCITAMANYVVWDMLLFWVYSDIKQVQWGSVYYVYPLPLLLSLGIIAYDWRRGRVATSEQSQPYEQQPSVEASPAE